MFNKILVAVDGSEAAAHAADVGAELAGRLHAEVVVLHVVDITAADVSDNGVAVEPMLAEMRRRAHHMLNRLHRRLSNDARVETMLVEAEPVQAILQTAEEIHADAIVIGVDNRGKISHFILGSVGDEIVRRAKCPVITVHNDSESHFRRKRRNGAVAVK